MKFKNVLTIFFISFFISAAPAFSSSIQTADDEFVELLNNIHTMQTTFQQFAVNNVIGNMTLERPGKFRWEVLQPSKQLTILNKNNLLLYDADLAQVTRRKIDYNNPANPAMLLSGDTQVLKQIFKIIKLKKSDGSIWFELRPKKKNSANQNSGFQWIKMHFIAKQLKAIYIFDNFGQQSEIHFANIVLNSEIAKDKFIFVIPPKTDVLDEG